MPTLISLPTFSDPRGNLTVIERILPFQVKRVFFIYDVKAPRGGHGHKTTKMALISVSGSVTVICQSPTENYTYNLNSPSQCLLLEPEDWHLMEQFSENSTLIVLASEEFNKDDYFYERYR